MGGVGLVSRREPLGWAKERATPGKFKNLGLIRHSAAFPEFSTPHSRVANSPPPPLPESVPVIHIVLLSLKYFTV